MPKSSTTFSIAGKWRPRLATENRISTGRGAFLSPWEPSREDASSLLLKELAESQAKRSSVVIREDEKQCRAIALALLGRNRLLNRDAIEAVERIQRCIESLGGFGALMDMQCARELVENERAQRPIREFLQRLDASWPGFSDFFAIINTEDLNDKETKAAIMRFAGWLGLKLKNHSARQQLKKIAREEGRDYADLLRWRYFPQAIQDVLLEKQKDEPQRMRLRGGKFIKTRKGKVAEKRPSDLSVIELRLWFRKQVYRRCYELLLCDDALARTASIKRGNRDGTIDCLDIEDFGSEEMALEEIDQDQSLLSFVDSGPLVHLTARENELLRVSEYFSKPTRLTAQEMKMSPSTVRVLKHRIVQKSRFVRPQLEHHVNALRLCLKWRAKHGFIFNHPRGRKRIGCATDLSIS